MAPSPTDQASSSSRKTAVASGKSRAASKNVNGANGKKNPFKLFRGEEERRHKVLIERIILGATIFACLVLVVAVWWTRGKVLDSSVRFLSQFAGKDALAPRDAALNCSNPKNANTPYCLEHKAAIEASWKTMGRYEGGKAPAFSLHGGGK